MPGREGKICAHWLWTSSLLPNGIEKLPITVSQYSLSGHQMIWIHHFLPALTMDALRADWIEHWSNKGKLVKINYNLAILLRSTRRSRRGGADRPVFTLCRFSATFCQGCASAFCQGYQIYARAVFLSSEAETTVVWVYPHWLASFWGTYRGR